VTLKSEHIFLTIISLVFMLSVFLPEAWGQLYQYTDKNGNVIFSDNPPSDASAKIKHLKEDGVYRSDKSSLDYPSYKGTKELPSTQNREEKRPKDYSRVTVVMYMTDWCGYCKQARKYINSLGAGLIEYNIDRDQGRKDEMKLKSGGSTAVPLIDIDGAIIRGYSETGIKAALDRSAAR
jgi:glutaredoxin